QAPVGGDREREVAAEDLDPGEALAQVEMGEAVVARLGAVRDAQAVEVRGDEARARGAAAQVAEGYVERIAGRRRREEARGPARAGGRGARRPGGERERERGQAAAGAARQGGAGARSREGLHPASEHRLPASAG